MLPIRLSEEQVDEIFDRVRQTDGYQLSVDLVEEKITDDATLEVKFEVEPFRRHSLLEGLDDIGLTLQHEDKIRAFEERRLGQ